MFNFGDKMNLYLNQAKGLLRNAENLLNNSEGQGSFLEENDANHDGKLTVQELKKTFDSNRDGYLDAKEVQHLALKAGASGFDTQTVKALGAAVASAQTELPLFNKSAEGQWQATEPLKTLKQNRVTALPYSDTPLASRELQSVAKARKGLFRVQEQVGNSCGTTSLSMLLKYFQGHTLENSVTTIDKYIRAQGKLEFMLPNGQIKSVGLDGYTAPRDIVKYANQQGMRAGLQNNSSLTALKKMLDKGVPCLCLTDWNFAENGSRPSKAAPDAQSLHWVNLIGYETQKNPQTQKSETVYLVANPHGVIQRVAEKDFDKVWSGSGPGLEQQIPGNQRINTGMMRLFVAMVPRDEETDVVAPDGSVLKAGDIAIPSGSDGIRGKLAQMGSEVMQKAGEFQDNLAQRGAQIKNEVQAGWEKDGVWGALKNFWGGDNSQAPAIRARAKTANPEQKAQIVNELLAASINRSHIQQLVYDILKDASWVDFPDMIQHIDMRKLATRLEDDQQAGQVLAWVAKVEVKEGKTGPKFDAFAVCLAQNHREGAIEAFLNSHYTREGQLLHKVPAAAVRLMVEKLLEGVTDGAEETAIYHLLQGTSWQQFDQVLSRLNMATVASELENTQELGSLTAWVTELGLRTQHWSGLGEILTQLESMTEFGRADDVLGIALTAAAVKGRLAEIPAHLRQRMIDLMDDRTRWRSEAALQALAALKNI
ncbi:MAG: C39 family peptidase [Candidatus Sericytochromatia bacterium]